MKEAEIASAQIIAHLCVWLCHLPFTTARGVMGLHGHNPKSHLKSLTTTLQESKKSQSNTSLLHSSFKSCTSDEYIVIKEGREEQISH